MLKKRPSCFAIAFLALVVFPLSGFCQTLASVDPKTVGFSPERLQRLHALLQKKVDDKKLAGIVTVLARHGKIVDFETYGKSDLASGAPMQKNAIFRIFSMTKPITGVAMMILYEQGKWSPGDPISKYIPEFAGLKVLKGVDSSGQPILEDPLHPPTMAELMSHTAGFTYGIFGSTPVDKMYRDAGVLGSKNLQDMIDKLAKIPLLYQPGTKWVYSVSVDIQGYIVEKLSGKPLGEFFRENIFDPLGMQDTGFHLPAEKLSRLAAVYTANAADELHPTPGSQNTAIYTKEPSMPSGGGGLLSTTQDYVRFCQMLLNGGELGGVRILAPSSVALMRTNRLPSTVLDSRAYGIAFFHVTPGSGFGFDFGVFDHPGLIGQTVGAGTYFWSGAAGTWFWIDPTNDIVFVGMIQRMLDLFHSPDMDTLTHQVVYQALINPAK